MIIIAMSLYKFGVPNSLRIIDANHFDTIISANKMEYIEEQKSI